MKQRCPDDLKKALRFYFITDENVSGFAPVDQADVAIQGGCTIIQYRHKTFTLKDYEEAAAVRDLCRRKSVPFIVNDHVLLAKALQADGVHIGQDDEDPWTVRRILGDDAIVGISVSTLDELERTHLEPCDYIGTGPVFPTDTKKDAKAVTGVTGLEAVAARSGIPVVAIGGIDAGNAFACFEHGAVGIAVISAVTRAQDPLQNARALFHNVDSDF